MVAERLKPRGGGAERNAAELAADVGNRMQHFINENSWRRFEEAWVEVQVRVAKLSVPQAATQCFWRKRCGCAQDLPELWVGASWLLCL